MIVKCPIDGTELDLDSWETITLFKSGESIMVWPRCGSGAGHWISVFVKGKTASVRTGLIPSVPPAKSFLPTQGLSPAPRTLTVTNLTNQPNRVRIMAPPMVIVKRKDDHAS